MKNVEAGNGNGLTESTNPMLNPLRRIWSKELRGKIRIWGSWIVIPLYLALVHQIPNWAGILTLAVGTGLRFWASGYLQKESRLCTRGPYAITRNPLYLGSLLVALSMPLGQAQWVLTLAVALIFLALFRAIVAKEEAVLATKFDPDYGIYRRQVPMFIGLKSLWNLPRAIKSHSFDMQTWRTNRGWEPVCVAAAIFGITSLVAYLRG